MTDKYIIAVPKSGCLKTIKTGIIAKNKIKTIYTVNLFLCLLSEKRLRDRGRQVYG